MLLAILGAGVRSASSGLAFSGGRVCNIDRLAFCRAMLGRDMSVSTGVHIWPRDAPCQGAKLCSFCSDLHQRTQSCTLRATGAPFQLIDVNRPGTQLSGRPDSDQWRRRKFTTSIQPAKAYFSPYKPILAVPGMAHFLPSYGGGGGNSLRPYSQQRPMRTNLSCCLGSLGLIDNGQYKSTNRLLVVVPHDRPHGGGGGNSLRPYSQQRPMRTNHGIMRILKNCCMLLQKALKMRAIKNSCTLLRTTNSCFWSQLSGSIPVRMPSQS